MCVAVLIPGNWIIRHKTIYPSGLCNMPCIYTCKPLSPCRLYNKMTMEVILSTAFGRVVDVQGGKGGKLYECALTVFNALAPRKENEPMSVYRILQFLPCKLPSWYVYPIFVTQIHLYMKDVFLLPNSDDSISGDRCTAFGNVP